MLDEAPAEQLQVVVTESIFSMDGDAADLRPLAELKQRRPFLLLLDEAHGSGVYGVHGAGYAAEAGYPKLADLTVLTLSKAVGVAGGAICGSAELCEAVVNFGRAFIYTTHLPPAVAAGVVAAIDMMRDEPDRQQRVRSSATRVRARLQEMNVEVPAGDSPIVPILLGDEHAALRASSRLLHAGLLVTPIRPPTVARGTSRLRLTLSSEHTDEQILTLLDELRVLRR